MRKRLTSLAILIISIGLIINVSRNILRLLRGGEQIKLAEQRLKDLQEEHQKLKDLKKYYQSEEFIEEEARNKLNMSRPGEIVVILPLNVSELVGRVEPEEYQKLPNWRKWWKLFF